MENFTSFLTLQIPANVPKAGRSSHILFRKFQLPAVTFPNALSQLPALNVKFSRTYHAFFIRSLARLHVGQQTPCHFSSALLAEFHCSDPFQHGFDRLVLLICLSRENFRKILCTAARENGPFHMDLLRN